MQQKTAEAYPVFDARREEQLDRLKEEAERKQQERMKPVPFLLEDIPTHYREGSLVTDSTNRIGYLRDLNGFQPMFYPLQLTGTQQAKAFLYNGPLRSNDYRSKGHFGRLSKGGLADKKPFQKPKTNNFLRSALI